MAYDTDGSTWFSVSLKHHAYSGETFTEIQTGFRTTSASLPGESQG